jgi:hypothetical protein
MTTNLSTVTIDILVQEIFDNCVLIIELSELTGYHGVLQRSLRRTLTSAGWWRLDVGDAPLKARRRTTLQVSDSACQLARPIF